MDINELLVAEAEAAERGMDAAMRPDSRVSRGHQRARTLQVRMNVDELELLTREAERRGLPISTLARDLLLAQLARRHDSTQALIAKLRADLDDLAARVA